MKHSLSRITAVALLLLAVACGDNQTSAQHLDQAKQYLAEDSYEAAVIELKNAVRKDGQSAEARYLLGKLQLDSGATAAAEKELQSARRLGWPAEQVSPALARAMLAERKFAQIRELDLSGLSPEATAEVLSVQAVSELAQGEIETAAELIAKAQEAAPGAVEVLIGAARVEASQGDLEGGLASLDQALAVEPDNTAALHLRGDILLAQRETDAALTAYNKVLELQPENLQVRLRRAIAAMTRNDFDTAAEDAQVLMERAPNNPGSNYVSGLVAFQQKDYDAAAAAFTVAEPAFRQYPMLLYYLASAHLAGGNADLAENFAERFVAIAPNNIVGRKLLATLRLQRGDNRDVQSLLQPVLVSNPDDIGALTLMANALLRDGKTDEGITLLARLAELQPDSAEAQVQLGAGLLMSGENDAAVQHIETALELNPEFQQADILLVLNHLRKQEYEAAIEAAKAYVGRNPASVTPYNLLGRVYLESGDRENARKAFANTLRVDKGDIGANHNLARFALAEDDVETARSRYMAVLSVYPDSAPAMIELAKLEAGLQDEQAMLNWLVKAAEAQPKAVEPRIMLGRYYLSQGRGSQVPPLFVTLDPMQQQNPEVLRILALAQLEQNQPFEAQRTLEKLIETTPDTAAIRQLMARAAVASGDYELARRELRAALQLDENYFPARLALARLELAAGNIEIFKQELEWLTTNAADDVNTLQLQAQAALLDKRPEDATLLARRAYEQAPNEKTLLALANVETAAGDPTGAQRVLEDWLTENPDSTGIRLALAISHGLSGKASESLAGYQRVLESDPENFTALNNLAWETRESDPKSAIAYAQRALEVSPGNAAALDTLAMAEYYSKDYEAAERSIARALDAMPKQPSMLFHQAMIDKALGKEALAARNLKRLLEQHAEFPEIEEARTLLESIQP